jgi:hypothetical protein
MARAARCQFKVIRMPGGGKKVRARLGRSKTKKCELSKATHNRIMKKHGNARAYKEHIIQMHVERSRRMMDVNAQKKKAKENRMRRAYA